MRILAILPAIAILASAASAEPFGNIDIGGGYNWTKARGNDIAAEGEDVGFLALSASLTLPVGAMTSLSLDGNYRRDYFTTSANGGYGSNAPISTYEGAVHILHELSPNFMFGGFYGYGDSARHDRSVSDQFNVHQFGVEARAIMDDSLIGFGQFSMGYKGRDGEEAFNGYEGGAAGRIGFIFEIDDSTNWMIDGEYAFAPDMFEGEDDGKFYGVSFSGETELLPENNIYLTYFGGYRKFDGTTETDSITETYIGAGLSIHFNGGSRFENIRNRGSIGIPSLPNRASSWTDEISDDPNSCFDPGTVCDG